MRNVISVSSGCEHSCIIPFKSKYKLSNSVIECMRKMQRRHYRVMIKNRKNIKESIKKFRMEASHKQLIYLPNCSSRLFASQKKSS